MSQLNLNESTRDIQSVINSISGMVLEAPESLIIVFSITSSTSGMDVIVWENTQERETLLHEIVYTNWENALEEAIDMESKLAELIIVTKEYTEVAV